MNIPPLSTIFLLFLFLLKAPKFSSLIKLCPNCANWIYFKISKLFQTTKTATETPDKYFGVELFSLFDKWLISSSKSLAKFINSWNSSKFINKDFSKF